MPTYDYKCDKCGHEFEIYQSMKDEKLTACPSCGEKSLKRLIGSGGGLIFKGSGFYLTDYKNKPVENTAEKSTGTETKKPEQTKPAAETAAKTETTSTTETPIPKTEKKETKTKPVKE